MHSSPPAGRSRPVADDRGISIVEVLVAITLLAVTMAATASGVIRSLQVARDSRESVIAANIAQFELERVRSIPFVDWVVIADGGTSTTSEPGEGPDGQAYQVTREATWVSAGADTDGCDAAAAGGSGADYVRVRQIVSFPARPEILPVESVTVITPRLDFYDAYAGNLAIVIRDRDGVPSPGHNVRIQGSTGIKLGVTDANGCAFFPFLEVDVDTPANNQYTITVDTPGHVERRLRTQQISDTATIGAQSTTLVEYEYDESVSYDLMPTFTTPPAAGCAVTLVDFGARLANVNDPSAQAVDPETPAYNARRLGVECRTPANVAVPTGWSATIPYNLAYTVYNPATTWSSIGRVTSYTLRAQSAVPDTSPRPGGEVCGLFDGAGACISRVLFPYPNGYSIHAGRCPAADPTLVGASERQQMDADPGTTYTGVQVPMGLVTVTARDGTSTTFTGSGLTGQDVYADMVHATDCPTGDRLYLGRTGPGGILRALVPYGAWVFFFDRPGPSGVDGGAGPFTCATRPNNCTTIRPDATGPRSTGLADVGYQFDIRRGDRVTG